MSVDIFSRQQFEAALPVHKTTGQPLWHSNGLVEGEFEYLMPIDDKVQIIIRSSVAADGWSADAGEDSIRAWLVDCQGKPLGSKVSRWVTRVPGWDMRLKDTLRQLWTWRKDAGNCSQCGQAKQVYKIKKAGPNKGRIFAKCEQHGEWTWLTD